MARERIVSGDQFAPDEDLTQYSLRPKVLQEFIGQQELRAKLQVLLEAAKGRGEPVEHMLLYGPPGLGKTTLAHIIAHEVNTKIISTSGPALQRAGDLMGILTNLNSGDILFIDEVHRLSAVIEEFIYPAMEDFKVDFVVDKGAFAKVINVPLKRFTLIGATTRAGMLSAPLRDRFGLYYHLDFYPPEDLTEVVLRSARLLEIAIDSEAAKVVAARSRGTPRIANRLLRRVLQARGDYQIFEAEGGRQGIDLVRQHKPDLVLLDLMMPDVDGFEVLETLRADSELAETRIIVITAKSLTASERRRLSGQIELLLQKGSFMDDDLLEDILETLK